MEPGERPDHRPAADVSADVSKLRRLALPTAIGVAAAAILLARVREVGSYQVDDAYISFRYAANLARGFGPVFNPGERVEGISNLVWAVALAPFARFDFGGATPPALLAARALNVAFAVGSSIAIFRALARATGDRVAAALAALLLPAHGSYAMWTMPGLETIACATGYLVLATALANEATRAEGSAERPSRVEFALGGVFFLLPGVRPEAGPVALAIVAGAAPFLPPEGRRRALVRIVAPILAGGAAICAFRLAYYGVLLPNTFHAKADAVFARRSRTGYLGEIATRHLHSLVAAAVGAAFAAAGALRARVERRRPEPWTALAGAATGGVVAVAAFIWLVGRDWMFFHRYFVPAVPLVCVLAGLGANRLAAAVSAPGAGAASLWGRCIVVGGLGAALVGQFGDRDDDAARNARRHSKYVEETLAAAERVREIVPPGSTVAVAAAGALPYRLPDARFVDMLGLADRHVARRGRPVDDFWWEKTDEDYVLAREPDFIVVPYYDDVRTGTRENSKSSAWRRLCEHPEFERRYRVAATFSEPTVEKFRLFARLPDPG